VESYDGLRGELDKYRRDVDFILVDTIGKSPRNYGELGEMKAVLDACGARAEIHLCLASFTKPSDIADALKQFEQFRYRSVIITKLDETTRAGNVISALSGAGKSVSFITTGQTVPSDIERASVMRFLLNLEGFAVDRGELSKHFGGTEHQKET
jgi:flagellar biosynthesis protein FlhF